MNKINKPQKCLIMCTNPLQMIIAEKIIQLNKNKIFDLVVLTSKDNGKYQYYYKRLSVVCANSLYFVSKAGIKSFLSFKKNVLLHNVDRDYTELYLASIDSRYFQYIVSKNKKSKVYTFDDGLANIINTSSYYLDNSKGVLREIVWQILGARCSMKNIIKMSLMHYTIYKNIPNIIENTKFIQLLDSKLSENFSSEVVLKIYLGQPLFMISRKYNDIYVKKVIEKLGIDHYFPHPKEKEILSGNFKQIKSNLVFEDYIIDYLNSNPDHILQVYSFTSSCILNIKDINRVNVMYIHDLEMYSRFKDFYLFSEEFLNVKNMSVEL